MTVTQSIILIIELSQVSKIFLLFEQQERKSEIIRTVNVMTSRCRDDVTLCRITHPSTWKY